MPRITLRAARVNACLTQVEAAKRLGISLSTLKNWEKSRSYPTKPYIDKICKLYNLDYDEISF